MTTNSFNEMDEGANPSHSQMNASQKTKLGQQDFLRLMVAQIQNQTPVYPQSNGEFFSRLVQFGTNNEVSKMLESLQQLTTSLQSNQALQASALVGRKVLVDSDKLQLNSNGDVDSVVDILSNSTNIRALIYTYSGEHIKTISLGDPPSGYFQFSWDGTGWDNNRLHAGTYKVEVHAISGGEKLSLNTMTLANVDSVSIGQNGEGLKLNCAGVGSVSLDEVKQILV